MNSASKSWLWGPILFLILFVGLAVISATTSEIDRLWLNAPDWSRAKLVGSTSVRQPAALTVDSAGTIYVLTFQEEDNTHRARVLALGRAGDAIWDRTLDGTFSEPQDPGILVDERGLYVFWLDERGLYGALVDALGNSVSAPSLLSGGTTVDSYDLAPGPETTTIWFGGSRREPGIYTLSLQDLAAKARLIDAQGIRPAAEVDGQGTLHASWVTYSPGETMPRLYYAAFPNGEPQQGQPILVGEVPLEREGTLLGPWLGLDGGQIYLLWIDLLQSTEYGYLTQAEYLTFPLNQPELASEVRAIEVPNTDQLSYQPFPEGVLEAGQRVVLAPGKYPRTAPPSELWLNQATDGEMALALRADLEHQRESAVGQIGTLFMQDGRPLTYQLLTFNPKFSQAPAMTSDEAGYLYATWIERKDVSGHYVYLASTAPDIRGALAPLTRGDYGRMVANTFFGMLTGAVFFPIAMLLWLILPGLLLAATWAFRRERASITSRGSLVSIALALVTYWGVKLVTFARAAGYVPFSGWIPIIPAPLGLVLQVAVPVIITLAGLATAWYVVKRTEGQSALVFVIIYAIVDSFLTMAVYGGLLYDAF